MPNYYTSTFSVVIFLVSFLVFSQHSRLKSNRFFFSLLVFLNILLWNVFGVANYFTGNGIDLATIIQIRFGLRGAAFGAYLSLIFLVIGILFLSLVLLSVFVLKNNQNKYHNSNVLVLISYCLGFVALATNPGMINLYNLPPGTFFPSRASGESNITEFYTYYKKPQIQPNSTKQKNLVFIYAESFEHAFFDEKVFPNLVPGLKELEKKSISFTNMKMAHGTGGTIWAISASQCGLPLFLPNIAILNHGTGNFLPSATCFGDLLQEEGYYLTYYGGANLLFMGKGDFFRSHGFTDVFGKNELIPKLKNKDYLNFWGLYDDSLFDITYDRFLDLSAAGKKFGMFLLTIDTHSPGYPSKTCENILYQDGKNKYLNAVACSDYLISKFITKIINSPYASETLIVLASDHVNWNDCPATELLKVARDGRDNIFMIIDPSDLQGKEVTSQGTAFDIGPSILPFMGYSCQIGLGRNLLSKNPGNDKERSYIQGKLHSWKSEIVKFWGYPKIRKFLSVDIGNRTLSIDKKAYNVPIFIELTEDLEAVLLFGFDETLAKYLQKMESGKKFLMVGKCCDVRILDKRISDSGVPMADDGLCLVIGRGTEYIYKNKLEHNVHYSRIQLQNMLTIQ